MSSVIENQDVQLPNTHYSDEMIIFHLETTLLNSNAETANS